MNSFLMSRRFVNNFPHFLLNKLYVLTKYQQQKFEISYNKYYQKSADVCIPNFLDL